MKPAENVDWAPLFNLYKSFLDSLPPSGKIDPLHNEFVNLLHETSGYQTFVRSKVYVNFNPDHVYFHPDRSLKLSPAIMLRTAILREAGDWCRVVAQGPHQEEAIQRLISEVRQHRQIRLTEIKDQGLCIDVNSDAECSVVYTKSDSDKLLRVLEQIWKCHPVIFVPGLSLKFQETGMLSHFLQARHPICKALEAMGFVGKVECLAALGDANRHGTLDKLKELDFLDTMLTGCLKHLFGVGQPAWKSLTCLRFRYSHLNGDDLLVLAEAHNRGKLRVLNLEGNRLTGLLSQLFGARKPWTGLEFLDLYGTGLNENDILSLGKAHQAHKLPQLSGLNLGRNCLTGKLRHLFGAQRGIWTSLDELLLRETNLTQNDLKTFGKAAKHGKVPKLRILDIRDEELRGSLRCLFAPGGVDFPSLQELRFDPDADDRAGLETAKRRGKLRKLKKFGPSHDVYF